MNYYLGSFGISFGQPNSTDTNLNNYVIEKYKSMLNTNDSYFTEDYFDNILQCNKPNSYFNFITDPYTQCSQVYANNNILSDINRFKQIDATRFNYQNIIQALVLSFANYINNTCSLLKNDTNITDCILSGSKSTVIKPYLRNVVLTEDSLGNKNVRIFNNITCNDYNMSYTIYYIYGSINLPAIKA